MNRLIISIKTSFIFLILITMIQCSQSTSPNYKQLSDKMIGIWYADSIFCELGITTNIDQQIPDLFSKANGSIEVSAENIIKLEYIVSLQGENDEIVVSNLSAYQLCSESCYPAYVLLYTDMHSDFVVNLDQDTELIYTYSGSNVIYDPISLTITANQAKFFNEDSSQSVNLNGTLTCSFYNFFANQKTYICSYESLLFSYLIKEFEFIFFENKEYWSIFKGGFDEIEIDTLIGTWEVTSDNTIQLCNFDEYSDEYECTKSKFLFDSDRLVIFEEMKACNIDADTKLEYEECIEDRYRNIEEEYNLKDGSLESLLERFTMIFRRYPCDLVSDETCVLNQFTVYKSFQERCIMNLQNEKNGSLKDSFLKNKIFDTKRK